MEQRIIIVWSFGIRFIKDKEMDKIDEIYLKELNVSEAEDKKILAIRLEKEADDDQRSAVLRFLQDYLGNYKGHYLLLLHNKPDEFVDELPEFLENIEYHQFGGGSPCHGVLYSELITDSLYFQKAAFVEDLNTIKISVFDNVWDEYRVDKKLESIRKQTHYIWHPLAIDIQGLSDVKSDVRLSYLRDIYSQRDKDYHKQLLLNFLNVMFGYMGKFLGFVPKINYTRNLFLLLNDYSGKGVEATDFFSSPARKNTIDIGWDFIRHAPNENSQLVKLMMLLDQFHDPKIEEFPKNLLEYINKKSDFYFPQWLLLLEQQFDKIAKEIDKTRILDKN